MSHELTNAVIDCMDNNDLKRTDLRMHIIHKQLPPLLYKVLTNPLNICHELHFNMVFATFVSISLLIIVGLELKKTLSVT